MTFTISLTGRGEARYCLVEQYEFWLGGEGAGHFETLFVAYRQAASKLVSVLGQEA